MTRLTYLPECPKRTITAADIDRCEAAIKQKLPPRFKAFLLEHDGPVPMPGWLPVKVDSETKWLGPVHTLLSVMGPTDHRGRVYSIDTYILAHREGEKLPRHFIVIGTLLQHPSILLMSIAKSDYGTIHAWHVSMKRFKPDQLVRVAASFEELMTLWAEPPGEVAAAFRQLVQERAAARQAGTQQRPQASEYDGPEARRWLRSNRNLLPLAANHFGSAGATRQFVDELYAAGATKVIVPANCIMDQDDEGPYADSLAVFLPQDAVAREKVCLRCERELDEPAKIDASDLNPVFLWWD